MFTFLAQQAASSDQGSDDFLKTPTVLTEPKEAFNLLGVLFSNLFTLALFVGAIVAFVFIIIGAYQYISAQSGDGAAQGRKTITAAVVGLIALALVYVFIILYNSLLPSAPTSTTPIS